MGMPAGPPRQPVETAPSSGPVVTVVIPTRNRAPLLAQALHSVLGQLGVSLEVVIVDEGSSDETPRLLAQIDDPRIRVVRHEQARGVAAARNAGISLARGSLLAFSDDDDLWAPSKLGAQIDALAKAPGSGWCQVGDVAVDDELTIIGASIPEVHGPRIFTELLQRDTVPGGGSGVVARTELVRDVGGFDTRFANLADWELWIRLAREAPIATVRRPLVAWRSHAGGMSCAVEEVIRETELLEALYRDERSGLGVELDVGVGWQAYLGDSYSRGGRRWAAARHHLRLAYRYDRVGWLALAGRDILTPSYLRSRERARGAATPTEWREEAEEWLLPMRARSSVGLVDGWSAT